MSDTTAPRRSDQARLMDKATRILAMRDHSEWELRRKLKQPPSIPGNTPPPVFSEQDIDTVIAWCYEHHWLDDARFASRFVASRARKGYGPQRVRQELQQKGIDRHQCDEAILACDIDWSTLAREIAERKFGDPLPSAFADKVKVQRYLQYRGFYGDDIQALWQR
ncbi:regulatory protein RecX [Shimwellia pseudoproteus]|uniref:regulatory protein RecX n=1 Tax=Shimwellia pseudoproteus TaxID=570012 RepID=UPI0018EA6285|nr:regulatory protein RecX [Shimwellia pseudoproteus]MBJ3816080.1 regulatory protein RecX [Shimwellia pseudoproteus]